MPDVLGSGCVNGQDACGTPAYLRARRPVNAPIESNPSARHQRPLPPAFPYMLNIIGIDVSLAFDPPQFGLQFRDSPLQLLNHGGHLPL